MVLFSTSSDARKKRRWVFHIKIEKQLIDLDILGQVNPDVTCLFLIRFVAASETNEQADGNGASTHFLSKCTVSLAVSR